METKDLNKIMQGKFEEFCTSGKIEELFEKKIEETISELVSEQFRYSGKIKKAIEDKINEDLHIDLSEVSLAEHNLKIVQTIKNSLETYFNQETKVIYDKIVKELDYDKKEIKLSEIIEKLKDNWFNDGEKESHNQEITLIVEEARYGSQYIYIGKNYDADKYSCEVSIGFNKDGIWNIELRGSDINKDAVFSHSWNLETFLYKLKANSTKVILNENECDLWVGQEDY